MGQRSKQTFLQRRHTDGQETREKQIKTTMRCHLTSLSMTSIKKSTNNKCWRGCGEKGNFLCCWWECKWIQLLWKTVWRFLKKLGLKSPSVQFSSVTQFGRTLCNPMNCSMPGLSYPSPTAGVYPNPWPINPTRHIP